MSSTAKTFEQLAMRVQTFTDPKLFLLEIRRSNPSICILDLTTPKTDVAIAIIKAIRNILGSGQLLMTLVTAKDSDLAKKAKEAGASAVIAKPLELRPLAQLLSRYVLADGIAKILNTPEQESKKSDDLELASQPLPSVINWFFEKMMPVLASLEQALVHHDDVELQLKHYAELLAHHGKEVTKMVATLRKTEEELNLLQSLRLYGVRNTRALVLALTLGESTDLLQFRFNPKTNLPTMDAAKVFQYAFRAGDIFGEDSRYYQVAFTSGLVLDLIALFAPQAGERKSVVLRLIDAAYTDTIKQVGRAMQAAKQVKDLSADLHIVSAMLIREAAKCTMALHYADYSERKKAFEKKAVRAPLQHILESQSYKVSSNILGALICQLTPGLSPAAKAVLFYDYAYLIAGSRDDKDAHALAKFCAGVVG